jgi:AcrR family transcriptional regulator
MDGKANTSAAKNEEARRKLIEAAGQIFAEVGYEAATVRQITDRAQVNVAAVNYYFRDKLQLYRTVLQFVTGRAHNLLKQHCMQGTAEERLRNFVRCIMMVESNEQHSWARLLMAREVAELHEAQASLLVEVVRPMHEIAETIVRDLAGQEAPQALTRFAAGLVVSVCVNRVPQQRLDYRLYPEMRLDETDIEQTIEKIYQFTLAGVRGLFEKRFP